MSIAALYARVSTDRQEKQETIRSQVEEVEQAIKKNGDILVDKFKFLDDGWSGMILARPNLEAMRDVIKEKQIEVVYVYDLGRLSRDFTDQLILLREFESAGIKFVSLRDINPTTPAEQLMQKVMGVFHDYDRRNIVEKFRRGKLFKAKHGNIVHGPGPYGYSYIEKSGLKEGYYILDQYEAGIVKKLFSWIGNEGLTIRKVIKRLQNEGIKPRKSTKGVWTTSTLCQLIHNEVYFGSAHYNKTVAIEPKRPFKDRKYKKILKTSRKLKPKEDWIKIPVTPIISKDLFDKAQEQLKRNAWFSNRCQKYNYLLSGLLFCSCGCRMCGEGVDHKRYYRCSNRVIRYPLAPDCDATGINIKRIDEVIWPKIQELLLKPDLLRQQAENWLVKKGNGDIVRSDQLELSRLKEIVEALTREEKKHAEAFAKELISIDVLSQVMGELKLKRQSILNQINKLEISQKEEKLPNISVSEVCYYVAEVLKSLLQGDKRVVMRKLISKIVLDKECLNAKIRGYIPLNIEERVPEYAFRSDSRDSQLQRNPQF